MDDQSKGQVLKHLLASLPAAWMARWHPSSKRVDMPGKALNEPGATLSRVYLPTTVIVSPLYLMETSAEITVVGREEIRHLRSARRRS